MSKVYAVKVGEFTKIGFSEPFETRFATIKTHSSLEPEILNTIECFKWAKKVEKWLHGRFAEYRSSGEWFRLPECEEDWIRTLSNGYVFAVCVTDGVPQDLMRWKVLDWLQDFDLVPHERYVYKHGTLVTVRNGIPPV